MSDGKSVLLKENILNLKRMVLLTLHEKKQYKIAVKVGLFQCQTHILK